MTKRKASLALVAVLASGCIATPPTNSQINTAVRERVVNQPPANASPAPTAAPATNAAENFVVNSVAVGQNALLANNLGWTFGGKSQRGWRLYTLLINRMINTEENINTNRFAAALARWQQGAGLAPSGVLDGDTLYGMISVWQSRRIKDRIYPHPRQLITAPASEFYDPTREVELRQVEREAYNAYKRMLAAAIADKSLGLQTTANNELAASEKRLKIISSFRSREYQERLRRLSPGAGRAGLAVNSPHFTGRALDLYVGGDPVETVDWNRAIQVNTPAYKWLVKNAERFGFHPYYYEPWHWEYIPQEVK